MASVFLSYDRDDAGKARLIAAALEKSGHSVWWDQHIHGGAQYSKEIEAALRRADAIVVLWSKQSVDSAWVRDEAAIGRDTNRLVPASIETVEPPLGFRQYQTVDLTRWKGPASSPAFRDLLRGIGSLTLQEAAAPPNPAPLTRAPPRVSGSIGRASRWRPTAIAGVAVAIAIAAAALIVWRPWSMRQSTPVVAITADPQSTARSDAEDLFVALGSAQFGRIDSIELVRAEGLPRADLILEVARRPSSASLVMLRAKDRQLLFSQQIETPSGASDLLKRSLPVAAAAALECAANSMTSKTTLPLDVLKDYLQACAQFSSFYGTEEAYIPMRQLEQVLQRAGDFAPAWGQLLLAGAFMRATPTDNAKPSEQWLRTAINRARQVDSTMPEIRLAELELLPLLDLRGRLKAVDELRADFPDDPFVLGARAEQLMLVGRNNEAVEEAERAVRLYPLAPYSHSEYVRALAFSGRSDRAFEELQSFAIHDDVGRNLTETRFRTNLRYGDPRVSLALFRKYGTSKMHEAFLQARIDPTPDNRQRAIDLARAAAMNSGFYASFSEVLVTFDRVDEAFDMLMRIPPQKADQFLLQTLFRPTLAPVRANPRFLRIAQRFGLLDYWRRSGKWPDFCSEPGLSYDCGAEAARLTS